MDLGVIAATFGLIAVAELPDKTMIATLVMGSRSRPVLVWLGASAAFAVHVTLAVVAGRLLLLLPHRVLEGIVTGLFAVGAVYLLFVPEKEEAEEGEREAEAEGSASNALRVVGLSFVVILLGEFGDLTQILTLNLVAHYHQPWSVFVGALAALVCVAAVAAFSGRALLRILPLSAIRRIGGVVLLGFAVYNLVSLVTS
jgi:putative Ca2+/H+ antiporter (TMEM165/GDT1 family)